jgi:hypothetical protein
MKDSDIQKGREERKSKIPVSRRWILQSQGIGMHPVQPPPVQGSVKGQLCSYPFLGTSLPALVEAYWCTGKKETGREREREREKEKGRDCENACAWLCVYAGAERRSCDCVCKRVWLCVDEDAVQHYVGCTDCVLPSVSGEACGSLGGLGHLSSP